MFFLFCFVFISTNKLELAKNSSVYIIYILYLAKNNIRIMDEACFFSFFQPDIPLQYIPHLGIDLLETFNLV